MFSNWNYPTQILLGAGRVQELPKLCQEKNIKAPLLVTDKGLSALPFVQSILDNCLKAGFEIAQFTEVQPNPTGSNIDVGVNAFRKGNHDAVIAIGGGSALDAGKAIALIAKQSCSLFDLEDIGDNWTKADSDKIAPTIAIPTTAGTGSEVGRAAVIVNEAQHRKAIIFHPKMLPEHVILDPELSLGLPAKLTAACGMDALSHSLEAFCATAYHPMAEGIAIEGIRLVKENLSTAVSNGAHIEARTQMLVASLMGATAFQRGLGAMHALAHPLGALYDAHHGMLNAVLMPYVLKANREKIEKPISRLTPYLQIENGFDGFLEWVLALRTELDIPHKLSAIISQDIDLMALGKMATEDASARTNPINFSPEQYAAILDKAMLGVI